MQGSMRLARTFWLLLLLAVCSGEKPAAPPPRPSILLVTLDTTRYDAIGPNTAAVRPGTRMLR